MSAGPVLILGARSDIAKAVAHKFAALKHPIQLAARNAKDLEADRTDLTLRYDVPVTLHEFDALQLETHEAFVADLGRRQQGGWLTTWRALGERSPAPVAPFAKGVQLRDDSPLGRLVAIATHSVRSFASMRK